MDAVFRQRVDLLAKTGYLKTYTDMAMDTSAAFWWSSQEPGQAPVVRGNGSLCFLNTGSRRIAVTCDHVLQGYLADKARYLDVECQFGNNRFDPERHLIDRSPIGELDLATFDLPEVFVTAGLRPYHHNALRWPPTPPVAEGQVVLYGGYPQVLRDPGTSEVTFPFQWFVSRIGGTLMDRFVMRWALVLGFAVALNGLAPSVAQAQLPLQRPTSGERGAIGGVVHDPTGAPLPDLLLFLEGINPGAAGPLPEGSTRTDKTGRYRFGGLPPGRYTISSPIDFFPGASVTLKRGESATEDMTLKIVPVEQQFTVCAFCATIPPPIPDSLRKEFASDATDALDHPVSAPQPLNGWEIYLPGMGIYPPAALESGLQGIVVVQGEIGFDGVPTRMVVVSAAHRELGQAAVDALAGEFWQPGRIRGFAIEVPFRFLIRYVITE